MTATSERRSSSRREAWWASALTVPLAIWLAWRVAHAVVLLLAGGDLVDDTFRWDSGWYLSVLNQGYQLVDPSYETHNNVAFFPGLAWFTAPFTWVFAERTAAFIAANLASATAFVAVHGAVRSIVDSRTARRAVIGLALWPTSFFLAAYYSEALFVTATAAAVWAARRDSPVAATLAAFVAGVTRSIGFAAGPVLAAERLIRLRRIDRTVVGYALSGPLALGLVAAVQNHQVGDPLAFSRSQQAWGVELAGPWEGVRRTVRTFNANWPDNHHWGVTLDSLAIVVVFAALVVVTICCWRNRRALSLVGWGWVGAIAPLCTTIFISYSRYVLAAWPALLVLGFGESQVARGLRVGAAVVAAVWSVALIRLWAQGVWVA